MNYEIINYYLSSKFYLLLKAVYISFKERSSLVYSFENRSHEKNEAYDKDRNN